MYVHKLVLIPLLALLVAPFSNAATRTSSDLACPENFVPIPSGLACQAANLGKAASYLAAPEEDCPDGFERVPGVAFCVAQNLQLHIEQDLILLQANRADDCPSGFSRAVGSTICTADNLAIADRNGDPALVQLPNDCPSGFHRPPGVRFCIAKNLTSTQLQPSAQTCPPGFSRPPGVQFCTAIDLIYAKTELPALPPPRGECPTNWHKPDNVNFCIPSTEVQACGSASDCYVHGFVGLRLHRPVGDLKQNPCPSGTVEVWWDMPIYDDNGLFVEDYVPARFCMPIDTQPAG